MKLLVTGANGFLGRYVVAEALRRGHAVTAVLRSLSAPQDVGWRAHPNLTIVQADLRLRRDLGQKIAGVDAVLHLAAAKSGDLYAQIGGTVVATENLLAAMDDAGIRRIVLVSSFAVYNYLELPSHSVVNEQTPIENHGFDRDEYAQTKLIQERLVREHGAANGWAYTILRPGVIYGRDNLFTARLGMMAGKNIIRIGAWARLPLTYVENCATAIVMAAENEAASGQTLNVVDDSMPTQRTFVNMLKKRLSPRPRVIRVNWTVMRGIARLAVVFNRVALKGRAKIPGLFVPARLHARCKPLRYQNDRIKSVLGWTPKYGLEESLERSLKVPMLELTRVDQTGDVASKRAGGLESQEQGGLPSGAANASGQPSSAARTTPAVTPAPASPPSAEAEVAA